MAMQAPPLFEQGPTALSRLFIAVALALFLMVIDARFGVVQPVRSVIATVLAPLQWLALQPIEWAQTGLRYFGDLHEAQTQAETTRKKMVELVTRSAQVEQLLQENARLRALLSLDERLQINGQAAEVLYDTTDPYTRRVVINKGSLQGVQEGSPVMDESGVLGQLTRVYPTTSEVTLLIDRDQVIPVLNTRSGLRGVAHGDPTVANGVLDLRFIPANSDVQEGDLFTTSGMDGVYAPGLPVARVYLVEKRTDSPFLRIRMAPLATAQDVRHVVVLAPQARVIDEDMALHAQRSASQAERSGARAGMPRAGASDAAASDEPVPSQRALGAASASVRSGATRIAAPAAASPASAASAPSAMRGAP